MKEIAEIALFRQKLSKFMFLREGVERGKYVLRTERENEIHTQLKCQKMTQNWGWENR